VEQVEQVVQQELERLGHLEQHLDHLVLVELQEFLLTLQEIIQHIKIIIIYFLQNNNESFRIKTTSIADIDYQVNYVDIDPFLFQQFQGQHKENNNNRYYYNLSCSATGISRQLKSILLETKI
jgi:hypothetical protein